MLKTHLYMFVLKEIILIVYHLKQKQVVNLSNNDKKDLPRDIVFFIT